MRRVKVRPRIFNFTTVAAVAGAVEAGGGAQTINVSDATVVTDDDKNGMMVVLTSGAIMGEYRVVIDSEDVPAGQDTIVVETPFSQAPAAGVTLSFVNFIRREPYRGVVAGGDANSITLASKEIAVDNWFIGLYCTLIKAGNPTRQTRQILDYTGATRSADIRSTWDSNPAAGDHYEIEGYLYKPLGSFQILTGSAIWAYNPGELAFGMSRSNAPSGIYPNTVENWLDIQYLEFSFAGSISLERWEE